MSRKITEPSFERFGFQNIDDNRENPLISDDIQQTLTRLLGWDYANSFWKLVITDSDGRLLVSTSPTKASANVSSNPTVTTTASNVLVENNNRKQALIQNVSGSDCYLAFGEDAVTTDGFLLIVGATYIEDVWLGRISAIVASGTATLHIQEME